jgi:PhnB protein
MNTPSDYSEKILHAELEFGSNILYISDNFPGAVSVISDKVSFNLGLDSEEELNELFAALSKGATNIQVPEAQFWGAMFGSLDDQFGVHWSFNYQLPPTE